MLPEDAAIMLAKVIFVVSAAMILCMSKVRAEEIKHTFQSNKVSYSKCISARH